MRGIVRTGATIATVLALLALGACSHKPPVNPDISLRNGPVQQQAGNYDVAAADY